MFKAFSKTMVAMALGATALGGIAATPAAAQRHDRDDRHDRDRDRGRHDNGRHNGWDRHDRGRDRVVIVRDRRQPPRVVYAYDWNRPDPRYRGYYAERYYRGGYAPVVVSRQTRIYRGYDNRYYCRRDDGTTGLIVGAALGGILGNRLDRGGSGVLGTVLGAGAGAAIGQSLDRGGISCR